MLKKANFFGDLFIYEEDNECFNNNYVHKHNGIISEISKELFEKIIRGKFKQIVKINERSHEHRMSSRKTVKDTDVFPKLNELRMLRKLGEGEFGTVFLVGKESNFYALKVIDKKKVVKR